MPPEVAAIGFRAVLADAQSFAQLPPADLGAVAVRQDAVGLWLADCVGAPVVGAVGTLLPVGAPVPANVALVGWSPAVFVGHVLASFAPADTLFRLRLPVASIVSVVAPGLQSDATAAPRSWLRQRLPVLRLGCRRPCHQDGARWIATIAHM